MSDTLADVSADAEPDTALTPTSDPISDTVQDDATQDDVDDETPSDEEQIALKVNGKTIRKPLSEVIALAQQYEATSLKLETAKREITEARAMKEKYTSQSGAIKDLLQVMKNGDIPTIHEFVDEKLGASQAFNKGVIDYVLDLWNQSKYTPEQKEAHENKKQLAKLKAEHEARTRQDQERAQQYQVNQWTQHLDTEVPKALKEIGLPDSEFIRGHVISTWRTALERGQTPTAQAVAAYVKTQLEKSKLNFQGQPQSRLPAMPNTRPRATAEAVNRKRQGEPAETGYQSWDTWLKTRGR